MLLSLLHLRNDTASSFVLLLWVILLTVSSDVGGYTFGKIFKWKKFKFISPNKTLSGVLGSFICSIISVFIMAFVVQFLFAIDLNYFLKFKYFLLALFFSVVVQIGDLIVSYLKRLEKIKDTGKILPGHGGIFDRVDGLMFLLIVANICYYLKLFP